jgi:hypothetical protein
VLLVLRDAYSAVPNGDLHLWELVIHAHKEEVGDCTDVVLGEATSSMYTWVAVNSASAGKAASSHQR